MDANAHEKPVHPSLAKVFGQVGEVSGWIREILNIAFESGRSLGREEAKAMVAQKVKDGLERALLEFSGPPPAPPANPQANAPPPAAQATPSKVSLSTRAPMGSVRPAVLRALGDHPSGLSAPRVHHAVVVAGNPVIKENTVRVQLNKLRKEGLVAKRGQLWFLPEKAEGPSGQPEPSEHELLGDLA